VTRIPGSKQAWAVGNYINASGSFQTLTEQWNGKSWNAVPSPNPGATENTFVGVTALSADAIWAVGYCTDGSGNLQTLIEQWNGTSWNVVPSPSPGTSNELWSVARVPNTGQLWAVGNYADGSGSQGLTEFYC